MRGFTLARWFTPSRDASGPDPVSEEAREAVLADADRFEAFGVKGSTVVLKTPLGVTLVERDENGLVAFDHVEDGRWDRVGFWMNVASVGPLGEALRAAPGKRRDFDAIFVHGRA